MDEPDGGARQGPEDDVIAPTVRTVTLSNVGDSWTATVDAEDASGIARIDVTPIGIAGASPTDQTFDPVRHDTPITVPFDLPSVSPDEVQVEVTVIDGAGNATPMTGKGRYISLPPSGTATLNDGASVTYSRLVTLTSDVTLADEMRTSVDGSTWTVWKPYDPSFFVTLPYPTGDKTVLVEYQNSGVETLVITIPIRFEAPPVVAGEYHSQAIRNDGKLFGWGSNGYGQIGDGTTIRPSPTRVRYGATGRQSLKATRIALTTWPCRLTAALGVGQAGQVGDGSSRVTRYSPVPVLAPVPGPAGRRSRLDAAQSGRQCRPSLRVG